MYLCTAPIKPLILDPPPQGAQHTGLSSAAPVPSSEVLMCSSLSEKLHFFFHMVGLLIVVRHGVVHSLCLPEKASLLLLVW